MKKAYVVAIYESAVERPAGGFIGLSSASLAPFTVQLVENSSE